MRHEPPLSAIGLSLNGGGLLGALDRLKALLPPDAAVLLARHGAAVTQVRLRAGRPVQVDMDRGGNALSDAPLEQDALGGILAALMEYSVYARQEEQDGGGGGTRPDDRHRLGLCACGQAGGGVRGRDSSIYSAIGWKAALRTAAVAAGHGQDHDVAGRCPSALRRGHVCGHCRRAARAGRLSHGRANAGRGFAHGCDGRLSQGTGHRPDDPGNGAPGDRGG